GAHGAAGDHAGTLGGRLHEHARRAVAGLDRVPQGRAVEVDVAQVLARVLHRLLERDRHFARLAVADADLAVAVAPHVQRAEGELAAALDGLADAVGRDHLLVHAVVDLFPVAIAVAAAVFAWFCHCRVSVWKGMLRLGRLSLWSGAV